MEHFDNMNSRIRFYFNLGAICFASGYILTTGISEELTVLLLLTFNIAVFRRLRKSHSKQHLRLITAVSILATSSIFIIQYQYRRFIDWSCIRLISDAQANTSYLLTFLLFSIVIWELGIALSEKANTSIRA